MKKIITKSECETIKLGEKLAKKFRGGMTIALTGDLGTGKTTLIKGMAKGLGVKRNITSPTFVLMKIYDTDVSRMTTDGRRSRIRRLCHVDAYRINDSRELIDIGILEYINEPETLVIIEWAEKVKRILPASTIWVKMEHGKCENERQIVVNEV